MKYFHKIMDSKKFHRLRLSLLKYFKMNLNFIQRDF